MILLDVLRGQVHDHLLVDISYLVNLLNNHINLIIWWLKHGTQLKFIDWVDNILLKIVFDIITKVRSFVDEID